MIFEKIGTGNTLEAAVEDAKAKLQAPEDAELHFETLKEARKKLFGLKIEPAEVKVWYEVEDKPVKTPAPKKTAPAEKAPEQKKPAEKKNNENKKPAEQKKASEQKKPAEKKNNENKKPAEKKAQQEKKAPAEANEASGKAAAPAEEPVRELTALPITADDKAASYLRSIIAGMSIDEYNITLQKDEEENEYIYTIDCGRDDGVLIGRRGETLDAIQYLLRLSVNKGLDDDKHRKISVNIGNYRQKRNDNLRSLAQKSAKQVLKYGRNVALEPMNPYERRIIHTAIQKIEGVTSHSTGVDSGRRVIISLEEGVQPTNPSKGGYNNRGGNYKGGNRGGRGGRGGYQKKEAYKPSVTREPRKDAAGSLYGKIEVPSKEEE